LARLVVHLDNERAVGGRTIEAERDSAGLYALVAELCLVLEVRRRQM